MQFSSHYYFFNLAQSYIFTESLNKKSFTNKGFFIFGKNNSGIPKQVENDKIQNYFKLLIIKNQSYFLCCVLLHFNLIT